MQPHSRASLVLVLFALAACVDSGTPVAITAPAIPLASVQMNCALERASAQVRCVSQALHPSADQRPAGVRAEVVLPPEAAQLVLVFGSNAYDPATGLLSISIAVRNTSDRPMGTIGGTSVPGSVGGGRGGVNVFYVDGPRVTAGSGNVTVVNADGADTFTGPDQKFYANGGFLRPGEESGRKLWQWRLTGDVQAWSFDLAISTLWSAPIPEGFVGTYDMDPMRCRSPFRSTICRYHYNETYDDYIVDYHVTLNADYTWTGTGLSLRRNRFTGEEFRGGYSVGGSFALGASASRPGEVRILSGETFDGTSGAWYGNANTVYVTGPCSFECGPLVRRP